VNRRKKIVLAVAAVLVLLVLLFAAGPGRDIKNLGGVELIQSAMDSGESRTYTASREANLKAIYTALNLYQDSEGAYPLANGWMDAIGSRIRTTDMSEAEAAKKLQRPDLSHPKANQFGYAINDAVAGKFKGDLKDKKTILIFETSDLTKNAHGTPETQKKHLAISINGDLVKL
jgi:hypothetical protein